MEACLLILANEIARKAKQIFHIFNFVCLLNTAAKINDNLSPRYQQQ